MTDDPGQPASDAATSTRFGTPLFWAGLLALGQAATLAMIQAGPRVGYQHYLLPWRWWEHVPAWALAVVAIEVVAVLVGLTRMPSARRAIASVRGWRFAAIASLFALTSATGSMHAPSFVVELVLASIVQCLHLGAVVLLATSVPPATLARVRVRLAGVLSPGATDTAPVPGGPDRFAWVLACCVTLAAWLLAASTYEQHPHIPDEVAYLFQARYFASGALSLPLPPVPDAFSIDLTTYGVAGWFSVMPPGWPAILAVATAAGVPWLLNPLLGGVNILIAFVLLRELYPLRTARLAVLLLAVSPWHLFMSMNLMTHTATLTAALAAAAAVARLRRDPRLRWAVIGGTCIGIVGLIRPLDAVPLAALLGLWSLGARGARITVMPSVALAVAAIATSLLIVPYHQHLTGSGTTFPVMAYMDAIYGPGSNALGFGADRGLPFGGLDPLPGHGVIDVLINTDFNLFQTNVELLGWATGSMLILGLFLVSGQTRRADAMMLLMAASVVAIHSFYYFSGGPDFGARYWYMMIVPCIVLAARGIEELASRAERARAGDGARIAAAVTALIVVTMIVFVPWRAIDKYHHYRGMSPHVGDLANAGAVRGGVMLVRGKRHPDYASASVFNPLNLADSSTILAWDRSPEVRRQLVRAYPGRSFWIVEGPTVTGSGYTIMAGPLSADSLLARNDSVIPWP